MQKGNRKPMTARKPTPYHVSSAVNEAAEEIAAAIRSLENAAFEENLPAIDQIRTLSKALVNNQKAIRLLESIGAKTRP